MAFVPLSEKEALRPGFGDWVRRIPKNLGEAALHYAESFVALERDTTTPQEQTSQHVGNVALSGTEPRLAG